MKALVGKNRSTSKVIKLITGLFLTIAVITPWLRLDFSDLSGYFQEFSISADAAVESGVTFAYEETAAIIKQQTEAYILDKADAIGVDIAVDVCVSNDSPPVPYSVKLCGDIAPYAKVRLIQCISEDLGIPEVRQTWQSKD